MAPALDTVEGKKLFLVDVGFANSDNFMAQLNGWFEEHRPAIRTEVVRWRNQHIPDPSCASGSRPRATRRSSASAPDRAARRRSPATSSIWSRTTASRPWASTLNVFAHLVRNTVRVEGDAERAAGLRADAADEHASRGAAAVRRGRRPVHGRPFMAEVFDQLTRPVAADELRGEESDRSTPRYVEAGARRRCSGCSRSAARRTSCRSSCRPRSASSRCWRERATHPTRWSASSAPRSAWSTGSSTSRRSR